MSFLFPAFLWGILAVLIPLAIHLFNFRRIRRVYFTNVSFLKEIETQKSSFRRLKHLLILAARMLALACLALAFAQPYVKNDERVAVGQGVMSFYVDNSFSMQNEYHNKRFIDIATSSLDELLGRYPNLTSLQLVTNEFTGDDYTPLTASGLQERLTSTGLTPVSRSFEEVYTRQKRMLENIEAGHSRELFWISDFQKSTAGDLASLDVDSVDYLNVIPVRAGEVKNVYIDSVWLQTPFLREHQRNALHVRIRNSGNEPAENVPVRLVLEGEQISAASADIPSNGSGRLTFDFSISRGGYSKGVVELDDFPVTFDNHFYFVLNASPVLNILHLHTAGQSLTAPVERVYRNDSLFSVHHTHVDNVDVGQVAVSDLVILNEVKQPSPALFAGIIEFVKKGGSLLVIPPAELDETLYGSFLSQMGVNGLRKVAGQSVPVNAPDRKIPFFQDVFEASLKSEGEMNMPSATNVWEWSKSGNTLLALRNGQAFLSEISSGQGKLYLLGAPLAATNGNFAQHALFVPVMYKIAALSIRAEPTSFSFNDREIEVVVKEVRPNSVFKLKNGENEIIPVQRLIGNKLVLDLPGRGELVGEAVEPGYFELINNGKAEKTLALNLGTEESEMDCYTTDELEAFFAGRTNVRVHNGIEESDLNTKFDRRASGTRLWKYFLCAALVFLLAEILLVRLMKN